MSFIKSFMDMVGPEPEQPPVRTLPTVRAPPVIGATYQPSTVPATVGTLSSGSYTTYTKEELRPRVIPATSLGTTEVIETSPVRYQYAGTSPVVTSRLATETTSNAIFDALDKNHDGVLTRDELKGARVVETTRLVEPLSSVAYVPRQTITAAPVVVETAPVVPIVTEIDIPVGQRALVDGKHVVTVEEMQLRLENLASSVNGSIQQAISQVIEATNAISNACEERFVTIEKDCATRQLAMETLAKEFQARQQQDDLWRNKYASELRTQAGIMDSIEGINRKLAQTDAMISTMKKDMDAVNRGLQADLQASVETLRREMERCKDPRVWADIDSLRGQCEGFDSDIQTLRRRPQVDELVQGELENLQATTQDLQRKMNDLKRDVVYDKSQADAAATELRNDLSAFAPRVDLVQKEMTRQLEVWTIAVDERRQEFDVLQTDYQRRFAKNEKEIAELYASLPPIRADTKRMVDELQSEMVRNNAYVSSNHQRIEGNLSMVEELRRNVSELNTAFSQQGLKIQELEQIGLELNAIKRRLAA